MASEQRNPDKIFIKDLLLRCIVGIKPDEREKKQDVLIHLNLYSDLRQAGISDNITDTIDYATLKKKVIELVEGSSFYLVEKLAESIAELCLKDSKVQKVDVEIEKPGALRFARTVGIAITRERS
ncbi:MAG: dihydroneopterin aldolase [Spirochaetales bacterium]|nr:dihydroneopterin aldolase [Spirochaetales bacterium]